MLYEYKGKQPKIGENVFIAPTAVIIGDVTIEDGASIWYGAVLRGDLAPITIGKGSNIQDNASVHTDVGFPAMVGEFVTVGHNAVIHGCTIEDNCLIGIGSAVLNGSVVKKCTVVAAGSVIMEGQNVGPLQLVAGAPAAGKKEFPPEAEAKLKIPAQIYMKLMKEHISGIKPMD